MTDTQRKYDLERGETDEQMPVPDLDYRPHLPETYRPRIGLIGCGGITRSHLTAYRQDGLDVVAMCDTARAAAEERRHAFYPDAKIYTDYQELLGRDDIDVVDIALHPGPRAAALEAAILAGKHVLSQKPFVLDLDVGERLVSLAEAQGVKLAVNQNGRWAPYVRFIHQAIRQGLLGTIQSVNIGINWDHTWIQGTAFEKIHHIILYDFAVHWFDMCAMYFEDQQALHAYAGTAVSDAQPLKPPLIANAMVAFEHGGASLTFDAYSRFGAEECVRVTGSRGTIRSRGPLCANDQIILFTEDGYCLPKLEGKWFEDGFRGTMGELLCSVEEDREPFNSGRNNLRSLEITFAAIHSADSRRRVIPGEARTLGPSCAIAED